ncbi:small multi-drug export protein [Halobacteria archaeon AArc-m2/3/4]|uniref:Small multi-drug export protein n=1 Tax=Natronoglomus mannanivorans TaxID=2979990 RepID=A0AAP3E1X5_9EURY|nr:small multi-drug export protein [Halobacteria archaeon AArc-xg1-1]MCU4971175.1 small multi-drug export protein [Halobacteria archaeon AArc-m2/3/4]
MSTTVPLLECLTHQPLLFGLEGFETQAREWIDAASGPWQYLLIFALAATPWLEILIVIPIGIALGLDPLTVAVVAFAGNVIPIYLIVTLFDRISTWLDRRRDDDADEQSARSARAKRVWRSYGLPGLALAAPILTGVHLAAVLAMGLGARKRATLGWMTVGIALWTVVITVVSVTGVSVLEGWF